MQIDQLRIAGAFTASPVLRGDDRGHFAETFRADLFEQATGHRFDLAQANTSYSTKGVVRGVHYALAPPGQAKYVMCLAGRILDLVVDIRVASPTFGEHVAVELDDQTRTALYLAEGLGHAFCALSDTATVTYLCSTPYTAANEFGVHPQDPALALPWPADVELVISAKDAVAPTLAEAGARGELPSYAAYTDFLTMLRQR